MMRVVVSSGTSSYELMGVVVMTVPSVAASVPVLVI